MKYSLSLLSLLLVATVFGQSRRVQNHYLLVGTYTQGKSVGIYVYNFNESTGTATIADSIATNNPSYLTVSPDQHTVYAVNESDNGQVKAFSFNSQSGHLSPINEQSSMGANPCYVTVDATGKWLFAGNYSSGTIGEMPIEKDGSLGTPTQTSHHGHGVNTSRQEGPHVHATVLAPDNQWLFAPDLGIDTLKAYSFNAKTGAIKAATAQSVKLPDGVGPRHFVFHPNGKWAYLVQEMGGKVTTFTYNKGSLKMAQSISTLPKGFHKSFTSADIHISPDGKFLYASNRDSSNTIAIFRINGASGMLSLVGHQSTLGRTPRNFNFDPGGNYLLVANQNSDDVIIFKVDHTTGLLRDTGGRINVGNPVCLKWIAKVD